LRDRLINFVLYQTGWLIIVISAAKKRPWLGSAAGLFLIAVHLVLARERKPEALNILWIGLLGTFVDTIQAFFGVFVFESGYWSFWIAPFWITVMWMQFATLFHFALSWLTGRYILAAVLGFMGGPAAFLTGQRLGGVIFPYGTIYSLKVLALVWAVLLPVVLWISGRNRLSAGEGQYRI